MTTASVNLSPLPKQRFTDTNGNPLAGGKVFTYAAGTATKQNSYTDYTGTTPNPNPVVLDSRGEAAIWLDQTLSYKVVLSPSTDTDPPTSPIWTMDGIPAANGSFIAFAAQLATAGGSALMGFQQPYSGAILRTQQLKDQDSVSVLEFTGIDTSGATDSKAGLQAAFTACANAGGMRILIVRTGTYKVSGEISVGSNICVVFEPGVVINYTGDVNTQFFNVANQTCVYFIGNGATINGNRSGVTLSDTGNQTCFYIYGSDNVEIRNFNVVGFAFDGITLTGDTSTSGPSTNVLLLNNDVSNCGRNALSIVHADTVTVQGGRYRTSNGTPTGPWAGIDVEPNSGGQYARNIVFIGVKTQDNNGAGYQMTPGAMSSMAGLTFDVCMFGCRSQNDGLASSGSTGHAAFLLTAGGAMTNEVGGQVNVNGLVIENPNAMGVNVHNWDALNAPVFNGENIVVINPNSNGASTGNVNQTGIVVYCDSTQTPTSIGKLRFRNCKAEDNRVSPKMVQPAVVSADTGKIVQDVVFVDTDGVNYTSAAKSPVNSDVGNGGTLVDVVTSYTNPKPVSSATSITVPAWGGQRVNLTVSGSSFTLPLAAKCKGLYYEVQCDQGAGGNVTVVRTSTDTIKANGVAGATSYTLQPGDIVRFRSEGGTLWVAAAVA